MKRLLHILPVLVFLLAPFFAHAAGSVFFDPARKYTWVDLSNSNLTVTNHPTTNVGSPSWAYLSAPIAGKEYVEFKLVSNDSNNTNVGVGAGSTNKFGCPNDTICYRNNSGPGGGGIIYVNGVQTYSGTTDGILPINVGDVVGVATDVANGLVWFSVNGTWVHSGNPATGTNGFPYYISTTTNYYGSSVDVVTTAGVTNQWTLQPDAASQTYAAPAGFTPIGDKLTAAYKGFQSRGLGTYSSPLLTAVPVGTAYSTRRVLVQITAGPSYFTPTDVTINGTSVGSNVVYYRGSGAPIGSFSGINIWAWADVPTGTTVSVDVVSTASNLNGSGSWIGSAYTFDNTLAASAPTTISSNVANPATSLSNSIATDLNGFLITAIVTALHVSTTGLGITSSDETFISDNAGSEGSGKYLTSSKNSTASSAASNITWGWTNSSQALSSMLFWGPAAAGASSPSRKLMLFEGYRIKLVSGTLKLYQQ